MNIDKLWTFSKGESQTIAFIDTGLSNKVQETYKDRIVAPYNFLDGNSYFISLRIGYGQCLFLKIAFGRWRYIFKRTIFAHTDSLFQISMGMS